MSNVKVNVQSQRLSSSKRVSVILSKSISGYIRAEVPRTLGFGFVGAGTPLGGGSLEICPSNSLRPYIV